MDRLEQKYGDVGFYYINVDAEPELAKDFKVTSIPTTIIVVNGRVKKRWTGVQSQNKLVAELEKHLDIAKGP